MEIRLDSFEEVIDKHAKGAKAGRKPSVAELVDKALAAVSRDELNAFVRERCMEDPGFRQRFLVTCAPDAISLDNRDHLKRLRSQLQAIAGRKRFIDYNDAYEAGQVLHTMLQQARTLLAKGHAERALPMITAVIEGGSAAMQEADDSNGEIGGAIVSGTELLGKVAHAAHEEGFRKKLLSETQRLLADTTVHDCDYDGHLEPIVASLVRTEAEAVPMIRTLKKSARDEFSGSSAREALLDLTRRFEGSAAAAALEEQLLVHADVREKAIETAIGARDWDRARRLAVEGEGVLKNGRPATHAHYWTPFLLRIAQLSEDITEVIRLARILLLDDGRNGMEHYELLRMHVPVSEWPAFVDKLLSDLRGSRRQLDGGLIAAICATESRWDEVMAVARAGSRLPYVFASVLDHYEKELGERYPEEVATILAERAEAYASTTNPKNNDYVQAARLLGRLKKMGAVQLADSLAADWQVRLKRRKGLMAELGKL